MFVKASPSQPRSSCRTQLVTRAQLFSLSVAVCQTVLYLQVAFAAEMNSLSTSKEMLIVTGNFAVNNGNDVRLCFVGVVAYCTEQVGERERGKACVCVFVCVYVCMRMCNFVRCDVRVCNSLCMFYVCCMMFACCGTC